MGDSGSALVRCLPHNETCVGNLGPGRIHTKVHNPLEKKETKQGTLEVHFFAVPSFSGPV